MIDKVVKNILLKNKSLRNKTLKNKVFCCFILLVLFINPFLFSYPSRSNTSISNPSLSNPSKSNVKATKSTTSLFPVTINGKLGYVDRRGKEIIHPIYDGANSFSEGIAWVKSGGKWGIIDASGKYVLEPKFDDCRDFSEGLAMVKNNGKWGYIDKNGTFIIPSRFDAIKTFRGGLARVKIGDNWGLLDKNNKYIWDPQVARNASSNITPYPASSTSVSSTTGTSGYLTKKYLPVSSDLISEILRGRAQSVAPSNLYQLEDVLTFNVLDRVVINPATGQITLLGHLDERYLGLKIPYLQHLAELLEYPKPEFTLTWTPESERSVDTLFRQMDSMDKAREFARRWGQLFDDNGKVTAAGKWLLPIFGVRPPSGYSYENLDRFKMVGMIMRGSGNYKGAEVLETYGRLQNLVKANDPSASNAYYDLVVATNITGTYESLTQQMSRGQISQDQAATQLWYHIFPAMERTIGFRSGSVTETYQNALYRGTGFATAFNEATYTMNNEIRSVLENAMKTIFSRYDEIQIPPEVMYSTLGVRPYVVPEYIGMNKNSQLARVLFTSDYIVKNLINMPGLEKKISRYQSEFAFDRSHPSGTQIGKQRIEGEESTHHLWISIEKLDLAQSKDGHTLETRGTQMRFNIREKGKFGQDLPPSRSGYEELLTSLYDDLSVQFPVLHELQECAKLAGAARWLKEFRPDLKLPRTGRVPWHGPDRAPGIVFMTWSPNPRPGVVNASLKAMGGVSLDFPVPDIGPAGPTGGNLRRAIPIDSRVVDLKNSSLTITPTLFENQALKKYLRPVTEPPVPRPSGWVVSATKGEKNLKRITQALNVIASSKECNAGASMEITRQLEQARHIALHLKYVESAINMINKQAPNRQAAFKELEDNLREGMQSTYQTAVESYESLLFSYPGYVAETGVLKEFGSPGEFLTRQVKDERWLDRVETTWKIFKEIRENTDIEHAISGTSEFFQGILKFATEENPARDSFGKIINPVQATLAHANRALAIAETANRSFKIVNNLYTLFNSSAKLRQLTAQTDKELAALRDQLLPLQRELSNQLDKALKDPLVKNWVEGKVPQCP